MKSVQHYTEMYRQAAQSAITDEQVYAVGVLARPGSMKSLAVGQVSPLIAMIMRHRQKKRAGGFPLSVMMAVTPTRLISFQYRPRGSSSIKIVRTVAEWPWQNVRIETGAAASGRQLFFHLIDGTTLELESARSLGRYASMNDPFYASLGLGVRS